MNAEIKAMLVDAVTTYESQVKELGGDRATFQERVKAKRVEYESKANLVQDAETIVQNFVEALGAVFDDRPELTCAVYKSVNAKLSTFVKEEREVFLNGVDGRSNLSITKLATVDLGALENIRDRATALFAAMSTLPDFDTSDLPTDTDKNGRTVLKLSRLPKGTRTVDRTIRQAVTKKSLWTVDGTQYPSYTISMMRKVIDPEKRELKVQDIKDALGFSAKGSTMGDGRIHEAVINGKLVTFQVVTPLSPAEVAAVEEDSDEDSDDNE